MGIEGAANLGEDDKEGVQAGGVLRGCLRLEAWGYAVVLD